MDWKEVNFITYVEDVALVEFLVLRMIMADSDELDFVAEVGLIGVNMVEV